MKLTKILVAIFFMFYVVFLLDVCNTPYQMVLEHSMEFENGDILTSKLVNDGHQFDGSFTNRAEYFVSEYEEVLFLCEFYTEDEIADWVKSNIDDKHNWKISIFDSGEVNGLRYLIFSYCNNEDEATERMILGWIRGSNTGLRGTISIDAELANDVLEALTFGIGETSQDDKNYCSDIFDTIENRQAGIIIG